MTIDRSLPDIPRSRFETVLEIVCAVGVAVTIILSLCFVWRLPGTIPIHFGNHGRPDEWGSRMTIFVFPALAVVIYYPHLFARVRPMAEATVRSQLYLARSLMRVIKAVTIWLMVVLHGTAIAVALGKAQGFDETFIGVYLVVVLGSTIWYAVRMVRAR